MGSESLVPAPLVTAFLVVFARVGGALVFLPLPGFRVGPGAARGLFAFLLALAVFPHAPQSVLVRDVWHLAGILACEAAFGIGLGLIATCALEAILTGVQIVSIQAGYSYASTIDPTTQAESGVLIILAQMVSGLLFFSLGIDHELLGAFARSLQTIPPGSYHVTETALDTVIRAGSSMLSNGLLVLMPVIALILMADLALAIAGRMHAQLQMMALAFPIKMLLGLGLLAWLATLLPLVYRRWTADLVAQLRTLLT